MNNIQTFVSIHQNLSRCIHYIHCHTWELTCIDNSGERLSIHTVTDQYKNYGRKHSGVID